MKVHVDFDKITGVMKPMHGVGQPPMSGPRDGGWMHYLTEAGIPYSRLHDVQGIFGANLYVDIPNIFRDFNADENDPGSYDFAFTDAFIAELVKTGCKPFYRLGVTIENYHKIKAYRIFPPADFAKWARICEHIIRHYNEGWADGFHYGITYWEIWNEPGDDACYPGGSSEMWHGTPEQYYELYTVAASHLKKCFGNSIKVGGYAGAGFPYFELIDPEAKGLDHEPENQREGFFKFGHGFLSYIRDHQAPLDFFSWHRYACDPVERTSKESDYIRKLLTRYGFGDVEDILNEWNSATGMPNARKDSTFASSHAFATLVQMQRSKTSMMNYYDARCTGSRYGGLFNPETMEPYLTYFGFMMFNDAYKLKNEVYSCSEDPRYPVCAASDGRHHILLLANMYNEEAEVELDIQGADENKPEIFMLNNIYRNSPTGIKLQDNKLKIPPETCVSIRFF